MVIYLGKRLEARGVYPVPVPGVSRVAGNLTTKTRRGPRSGIGLRFARTCGSPMTCTRSRYAT